jgi:hypothetical protein
MQFNLFKKYQIHWFIITILLLTLIGCSKNNFESALKNTPQDATYFLNPATKNKPLVAPNTQKTILQDYINHYISPWTNRDPILSDSAIKQMEERTLDKFLKQPNWGENLQPYSKKWLTDIADNMALQNFPNRHIKVITLSSTNLRLFPTMEPAFDNPQQAGEGYPFDYLQESSVPPSTPAIILQTTRDGAWNLVRLNNDIGWIATEDLAKVDDNFISQWETNKYIAILKDQLSVFTTSHRFLFKTNLGSVYPLIRETENNFTLLVASADANNNAVIKTAVIPKNTAVTMPLLLTQKNIAVLANSILGNPYGWGGIHGYRDCSSTMTDLFTPFGVWLPRNSYDQIHTKNFITLEGKKDTHKENILADKGIPFVTLVGLPGHIMLYLGKNNGKLYVLQNMWGIHTKTIFGKKGRALIGKTVITPINFDKGYFNVPQSMLDRINSFTYVTQ